jgi:hypothetical protein
MLPGLRFLFAAIVLSTSVLIFGLGAAALLRAAHEEVANIPARRSPPEPVFTQAQEKPPTLAMLRIDPPAAETTEKAPESAETSPAPTAPTADASAPAEPEQLAAVKPDEPASTEGPSAGPPAADAPEPQPPPTAAQTDTPAPSTEIPAPTEEAKPAAVAEAPPASDVTPSPAEAPVAAEESPAAAKIATLGGPAVTVEETTPTKRVETKPEQSGTKKHARTQRAKERRRVAQRPPVARQALPQQAFDAFGQPVLVRRTR